MKRQHTFRSIDKYVLELSNCRQLCPALQRSKMRNVVQVQETGLLWLIEKKQSKWKLLKSAELTSVCLSVWSACLSVCLSVCMSLCLSVCMYVCLSICLSVCLSVFLFVFLSFWLSVSVCLSVCLSICLSICLSVCLSVCQLSVCLSHTLNPLYCPPVSRLLQP